MVPPNTRFISWFQRDGCVRCVAFFCQSNAFVCCLLPTPSHGGFTESVCPISHFKMGQSIMHVYFCFFLRVPLVSFYMGTNSPCGFRWTSPVARFGEARRPPPRRSCGTRWTWRSERFRGEGNQRNGRCELKWPTAPESV